MATTTFETVTCLNWEHKRGFLFEKMKFTCSACFHEGTSPVSHLNASKTKGVYQLKVARCKACSTLNCFAVSTADSLVYAHA